MTKWTIEKLKVLTLEQRHTLYKNCRSKGGNDAEEILRLLDEAGLPYSEGACVSYDDPLVMKMCDIVNSPEGVAAMMAAQEQGLPPLAGVDHLLSAALGVDYGKHNMTTNTAGELVVAKMASLGFIKGPQRKMPRGTVARSAVTMSGKFVL